MAKLASEARIPRQSTNRYFDILEDTLIVHRCEAFAKSTRKRLIQHPKYYFFDTGVLNALLGNFSASPDRKGLLFEHLFFTQMTAGAAAIDQEYRIATYRTQHGAEVDFIVEHGDAVWAIELKASTNVGSTDLHGLRSFSEHYRGRHTPLVVYLGAVAKQLEGIAILPWQSALRTIGL